MGNNESGRNVKESLGKEVVVVWACDSKGGALCRKYGVGNGSAWEAMRGRHQKISFDIVRVISKTVGGRCVCLRPCYMEANVGKHRTHIQVGII